MISGTSPAWGRIYRPPMGRRLISGLAVFISVFFFASLSEAICKPGLVRRDGRFMPVAWNFGGRGIPAVAPPKEEKVVGLRYLAHSSFLITGPGGGRFLTDPYWTNPLNPVPDAVSVSNLHDTHAQTGPYEGKTKIFYGALMEGKPITVDTFIRKIRLFAFPQVYGDSKSPYVINTIFIFQAGGICIAHLGNARFGPSEGQIRALGKIHVLLLPIDGSLTVPHEIGAKIVKRIGPNIVIPMHYAGPELSAQFAGAMKVEGFGRVKWAKSPELSLSLRRLPPPTLFMVLPPAEDVP